MNCIKIISACTLLLGSLTLLCHNTEHIVTEIKRETIEQQRFEIRREFKDGVLTELYLIDDKPVSFDDYEDIYLNAHHFALKKEMDDERQQALNKAAHEKEARHTITTRLLTLHYDELKAAYKTIKNYELEPHLLWSSSTIASKEDYEYATNQLIKEVDDLLACPEITQAARDVYIDKLKNYARRLNDLFQNTVNTLVTTTKDTKLLKRLMDIV